MQADLWNGPTGRTDDPEVLAELEVDYTPPAVAVQLLHVLLRLLGPRWAAGVRDVLDPAAGSGCWARAVRALLGPVRIHGIEPRASEAANLSAACDTFEIRKLEQTAPGRSFDFVATNPPFTAFARDWPNLLFDGRWLSNSAVVALYGLTQWGQSDDAIPMLQCWSPSFQLRCAGRNAHREDGKTDAREYSLWVWRVEDRGFRQFPSWRTVQVPTVLATARRRWRPEVVPGTYAIDPALVERIKNGL